MTGWLVDTLLWTAALILVVLALRGPVARRFGPRMAYALWLVPMARLLLPPLVLPHWMAPAAAPTTGAGDGTTTMTLVVENAAQSGASAQGFWHNAPLIEIALAIWLGGAALFLARRYFSYFAMRRSLLAEARIVGREGAIALVETPQVNAPVAFGVFEKIVALPQDFMAREDREARDLVLAHELAHHCAGDLLVNFLVQPLFALHWFSPLAKMGWEALRRDQEAACDARVVDLCDERERATYADIITRFAAGPQVALAAPMACPILGEKSIIHRLRSLKMTHISSRRRIAGRAFIAACLVAVPLTASISYAEASAPVPPTAPIAPTAPTAPVPPVPPAAPFAPNAPTAPMAPEAPLAPKAPAAPSQSGEKQFYTAFLGPVYKAFLVSEEDQQAEAKHPGEHKVTVIVNSADEGDSEGKHKVKKIRKIRIVKDGNTTEEIEEESGRAVAGRELNVEIENLDSEFADEEGHKHAVRIEMKCSDDAPATSQTDEGGTRTIMICKSKIMAKALEGLKKARAGIAQDSELSSDVRKRVLEALDERIANWNETEE